MVLLILSEKCAFIFLYGFVILSLIPLRFRFLKRAQREKKTTPKSFFQRYPLWKKSKIQQLESTGVKKVLTRYTYIYVQMNKDRPIGTRRMRSEPIECQTLFCELSHLHTNYCCVRHDRFLPPGEWRHGKKLFSSYDYTTFASRRMHEIIDRKKLVRKRPTADKNVTKNEYAPKI